MTEPKNSYPRYFSQFFHLAAEKEVCIMCDSEKQARNLREDFYHFRTKVCELDPESENCKEFDSVTIELHGKEVRGVPRR